MSVTLVDGIRATGNLSTNQLDEEWAPGISLLERSKYPLTYFSNRIAVYRSNEVPVNWFEDEYPPEFDAVNNGAGYASGDTAIVVDNVELFPAGTLAQFVRTGEVFLVKSRDITSSELTIVREYGQGEGWTTTKAAVLDNDPIMIISSTYNQDHPSPDIFTTKPNEKKNYCEETRHSLGFTETELASLLRGEQDMLFQQGKKLVEHLEAIEKNNLLAGKPYAGTGAKASLTSPNPEGAQTCGSFDHYLITNNNSSKLVDETDLTLFEFQDFMEAVTDKGSKERLFLCPSNFMKAVERWGMTYYNTFSETTVLGMSIVAYQNALRKFYFVPHDKLNRVLLADSTYSWFNCYAIDMDQVDHVLFGDNGGTRWRHAGGFVNRGGRTGDLYEYATYQCLRARQMETHGRLRYKTAS